MKILKEKNFVPLIFALVMIIFCIFSINTTSSKRYEVLEYEEYKYAFGDIFLEDFDYDDGKNFRGVYGCNDGACKKLFEEFVFYVPGDGTILTRGEFYKNYILFVRDDVEYFFWDIENEEYVKDNVSVLGRTNSSKVTCKGFKAEFNIEEEFKCETTNDFFQLYLENEKKLYFVDSEGNIFDSKESYIDYDEPYHYYDFADEYYYHEYKVSGLDGKDIGLKNNYLRSKDGYFYIQEVYDTECGTDYYVVSPKRKKVQLLKSVNDC